MNNHTYGTFLNPNPRQKISMAMSNSDTYSVQRRWFLYQVHEFGFVDEEIAESVREYQIDVKASDEYCILNADDISRILDESELFGWTVQRAVYFLSLNFGVKFGGDLRQWEVK